MVASKNGMPIGHVIRTDKSKTFGHFLPIRETHQTPVRQTTTEKLQHAASQHTTMDIVATNLCRYCRLRLGACQAFRDSTIFQGLSSDLMDSSFT